MRHRVTGRRLGYGPSHQKAMLRSLAGALIKYETIETTVPRAKELRRLADRLVTMGKKNTLHARRRAFKVLNDHQLVKKLFDEIAPRFSNRPGGYTRLIKSRFRAGDNAPLSIVTFVSRELQVKEGAAAPEPAAATIADEVKQGVEQELGADATAGDATEAAAETAPPAAEAEPEAEAPAAIATDGEDEAGAAKPE